MNTVKTYKGYDGTVEYDSECKVLRGKILFINDLVTYESQSAQDIQKEFESSVDDYIETCALLGREAQKSCSGQFSVRISPELHKKAIEKSAQERRSLNSVVVSALESYLNNIGTGVLGSSVEKEEALSGVM